MGQDPGECLLLKRCLVKTRNQIHKSIVRYELSKTKREPVDLQSEPSFEMFMGVIAFYQTYRQLEMDMARIFPTDPTKPLQREEIDGCPRKGTYIWR